MNLEEYKKQFNEDDSVGWNFIDKELVKIYSEQEPKHYAPTIHYALGGEEPLDGISIYKSEQQTKHFHFVTYGFSELYYDEESSGGEFRVYWRVGPAKVEFSKRRLDRFQKNLHSNFYFYCFICRLIYRKCTYKTKKNSGTLRGMAIRYL